MSFEHRLAMHIGIIAAVFGFGLLLGMWVASNDQDCVSADVNGTLATWCSNEVPPPVPM